jgi:hypothetical protein
MATAKDKKGTTQPAPETALAPTAKETALAPTAASTFATMEGYKADDHRGKEGITSEDMRLPFLSLAQKTSKAIDETEDSYIEGLAFGDMYNSELKTVYGKGPMFFIPLRHRKRAYLPDENGRMGEAIGWDDPRCDWPTEEQKKNWKGKGKPKPEGVRVYDWIAILLTDEGPTLVVISFKSKSFGAGQSLTTFVNMVKGPAFTAKYKIAAQLDTNDSGKFAKFVVAPAGKPSVEEAQFAETIYESVKDKNIVTDEDKNETDETPAAAGTVVEGQVVEKKDAPF